MFAIALNDPHKLASTEQHIMANKLLFTVINVHIKLHLRMCDVTALHLI